MKLVSLHLCLWALAYVGHVLSEELNIGKEFTFDDVTDVPIDVPTTLAPETTTTVIPITTTPVPTTTSVPTTTTTTAQPVTTPTPAPHPPNPQTGVWSVTGADNVTCIVVKMNAYFIIPYNTTDGQKRNATVPLPSNATAVGQCGEEQAISLNWFPFLDAENQNNLTLVFRKNESWNNATGSTDDKFFLSEIVLNVFTEARNFPNVTTNGTLIQSQLVGAGLHPVRVNSSYRCIAEERVKLFSLTDPTTVVVSRVQMESFRTQTNDKFSSASDCSADGILTSDIVPIAVGCALAALVVIVLIAYLVGRRRARQRGYQSV